MVNPPTERLGRYILVDVLGRGAMGTVYSGRDPELDRPVAIKVIQSVELTPEAVRRFRREAQALASVPHPHIVDIYDVGTDSGAPFIVMELVRGVSLARAMSEAVGYSVADKLRMTAEVCSALECAHAANIIHRDIKPANILIAHDGHAKLADFGVARLHGPSLTNSFHVAGTPAYMAPEAYSGREVDARADIYGLAATLYEWLCGSRPHNARDAFGMMALAVNHDAPDVRTKWPECPAALALCLSRGLARSPDDRFQSVAEFGAVLRSISAIDVRPAMHVDEPTAIMQVESKPSATVPRRLRVPRVMIVASAAGVVLLMVALGIKGALAPPSAGLPLARQEAPVNQDGATPPSAPALDAVRRLQPNSPAPRTQVVRPAPTPVASPAETDVEYDPAAAVPAVPVGTKIFAAVLTPLRTDRSVAGQEFVARVADPIVWNGREVVPVNTELRGIVDAVVPGRSGQAPSLQLSLTEIRLNGRAAKIRTARYTVVAPDSDERLGRARTIVIGAALGAVVGGAVGGERGVLVGAAAGGAAGTAAQERAVGGEYVIGNQLTFRLVEAFRPPPGTE